MFRCRDGCSRGVGGWWNGKVVGSRVGGYRRIGVLGYLSPRWAAFWGIGDCPPDGRFLLVAATITASTTTTPPLVLARELFWKLGGNDFSGGFVFVAHIAVLIESRTADFLMEL